MSFTSGGAVNLENAGKARIRGAEIELAWQPLPSFDPGLTLGGNASWLKAKYRDYTNARGFCERDGEVENQPESCNALPDGLAYDNGDFSGNRIVRTPKFSGNFSLSQSFEIPGRPDRNRRRLLLQLGLLLPRAEHAEHLRRRLRHHQRADQLSVSSVVAARDGVRANLGDERYNLAQFHTDFGRHDSLAPPRTWGLRLNWDF
uniref:TonB-dependent receptor-like beta-barrel domain-containing protein n=1 Tax=Hyaloperonospora arabidopsidis (strain Emoy2) TaxID=559515 RepID=M4C665_HYAAE